LLNHLRGIWRYHRVAATVTVATAIVGWLVVLGLPDAYQAEAKVYVDSSTALKPLLQGMTVDPDVDARLNLVKATLLGTASLERVARAADLDLKVKTVNEGQVRIRDVAGSFLVRNVNGDI